MRENNSAAVGEERVCKRDGGVQILPLPDVEIAMIACSGDDFEEELVWFRDGRRNVIQSESIIISQGAEGE